MNDKHIHRKKFLKRHRSQKKLENTKYKFRKSLVNYLNVRLIPPNEYNLSQDPNKEHRKP